MGKMVQRNYNTLIGRYPGADGMKTGFICASGFNLVAPATRDGKRLVAVVLGAPSSAARAMKAAQLLERGFNSQSGAVLADAFARHRRHVAADQCGAAQPARRDVRRPPQAPGHRGRGRRRRGQYARRTRPMRCSSRACAPPKTKGASLLNDGNMGEPVLGLYRHQAAGTRGRAGRLAASRRSRKPPRRPPNAKLTPGKAAAGQGQGRSQGYVDGRRQRGRRRISAQAEAQEAGTEDLAGCRRRRAGGDPAGHAGEMTARSH